MQYLLHSSIPSDFLDYLIQFGYKFNKFGRFQGRFTRGGVVIWITHLKVMVQHYDPGETVNVRRVHEFTEIDKLDFIGWTQLLDLTGALPFKEVLSQISRREIASLLTTIIRRMNWPAPGTEIAPTLLRYQEEENS